MSRPAESPGGLVNTEPALEPPGWCSRRQRTISATIASHAAAVPAVARKLAPVTTSVGPSADRRYPKREVGRGRRRARPPRRPRSTTSRLDEHVGGLAPVAARVHPHRAADAARDADEELEAAPTGPGGAPGQNRERYRRAGPDDVGIRVEVGRLEPGTEQQTQPREPGVGDQQVRPAPDDEERRDAVGQRPGERGELRGRLDPGQHRQRAADPVGREVGDGNAARDRYPGRRETRRQPGGVETRRARGHDGGASHSSGAVVRSPAPRVSTTSPGRASARARGRRGRRAAGR